VKYRKKKKMGLIKAILRFVVPLKVIAAELTTMRRLYEAQMRLQFDYVMPDPHFKPGKDDQVEILYGVKEQDPGEWNSDDGVNVN